MNIRLDRLKKLSNFLKDLEPNQFSFAQYITRSVIKEQGLCGTVCCAVGWMPLVDPEYFFWERKQASVMCVLDADIMCGTSEYFGIKITEYFDLFMPNEDAPSNVSLQNYIKFLDSWIKDKEVDHVNRE